MWNVHTIRYPGNTLLCLYFIKIILNDKVRLKRERFEVIPDAMKAPSSQYGETGVDEMKNPSTRGGLCPCLCSASKI